MIRDTRSPSTGSEVAPASVPPAPLQGWSLAVPRTTRCAGTLHLLPAPSRPQPSSAARTGNSPAAPAPALPSQQKPRSGKVSQSTHLSSSSGATDQKTLPGMSPSEETSQPSREREVLGEPQPQIQQVEAPASSSSLNQTTAMAAPSHQLLFVLCSLP